jgi:hypothetical protein
MIEYKTDLEDLSLRRYLLTFEVGILAVVADGILEVDRGNDSRWHCVLWNVHSHGETAMLRISRYGCGSYRMCRREYLL